jgi:hypothetical protein
LLYTSISYTDYNKNITFDIIDQTPDRYWEILAECARIKLDDELRENQQVFYLKKKKSYINDYFFL